MTNMFLIQGEDNRLLPWWFVSLKSLKKKASKFWNPPAVISPGAGICADFSTLIFSPIPLPNLIGNDGGIKLWNPKKGFLNLSLWNKTRGWTDLFSMKKNKGWAWEATLLDLDGQRILLVIHASWVYIPATLGFLICVARPRSPLIFIKIRFH